MVVRNTNSSNGGTQHETRAMVVLNNKLEAMVVLNRRETRAMVVLNTGRNSSNGGTQQNEQQRDDMRDNQTCVKSGLRPRIRRGSSGYRKTAQATDRLVMENRTHGVDTEQRLCIERSCLAWWLLQGSPGAHESTPGPHMSKMIGSNRRVRSNHASCHFASRRRRARTCTELFVEQDAVDVLEQDAVDVLHCGTTQKKRLFGPGDESAVVIIVLHTSSVLVTVHQKKKNKTKLIQPGKRFRSMFGIFPELGGSFTGCRSLYRNFRSILKTPVR